MVLAEFVHQSLLHLSIVELLVLDFQHYLLLRSMQEPVVGNSLSLELIQFVDLGEELSFIEKPCCLAFQLINLGQVLKDQGLLEHSRLFTGKASVIVDSRLHIFRFNV